MKKFLFAFIAVAALALTGCEKKGLDIMSLEPDELDNTEFKCWTFTISNSGLSDGTMYAWDTESNVVRKVAIRLLLAMRQQLMVMQKAVIHTMIFKLLILK